MSFGIGIGAFVSGLERGYGISTSIEDRKEAQAERADERAWRDEQRIGIRQDRAFAQSERDRTVGQRQAIEKISSDAQTEFDNRVASGDAKAGDFDKFWKEFALPKMQSELLQQGDIDGAKKLMEWGDSEAALKGGRLFAGAMFKAQTGDHAGALDDAIEAGKLKGYIADDFDIDEKEPIESEDGTLLGYRITIRDANGDETVQDVALDDIPSVIASFTNPEAAWASQAATAADTKKRANELDDYEAKKEIDARTSGNENKARTEAIKALRERMKVDALDKDSVNFDDLSRDQREKLIAEEISFAAGDVPAPAPDARRMIVDSDSGRPVVPAPNPADAPGMGAVVPEPTPARPGLGIGAAPRLPSDPANATINGRVDPGLAAPPTKAQLIDRAAQTMVEGGDPNEIARSLTAVGVDQSEWPVELVRVLTSKPAGNAP